MASGAKHGHEAIDADCQDSATRCGDLCITVIPAKTGIHRGETSDTRIRAPSETRWYTRRTCILIWVASASSRKALIQDIRRRNRPYQRKQIVLVDAEARLHT